jgi:catechol 2,3-dioxygenase-like lactoylglutathione lyase family enzyme
MQLMATSVAIQQVVAVLPASDLDRARQFYSEKLGLTPRENGPDGLFYQVGTGSAFLVYHSAGPASGQHTQAGFLVDELDAAMADLRSRGVTFEEYDMPGLKTEAGVVTMPTGRGAFFKDSEGNVLALNELDAQMRSQMGL